MNEVKSISKLSERCLYMLKLEAKRFVACELKNTTILREVALHNSDWCAISSTHFKQINSEYVKFRFLGKNESVVTKYSYKYSLINTLMISAGF